MRCSSVVLVLDTNEYIRALGSPNNPSAETLLNILILDPGKYSLCIPGTVIREVRCNLSSTMFSKFMKTIRGIARVDEDFSVPFEFVAKYESLGFKSADAFIAAYCEWIKADILVTENRHFLMRASNLPFKVLNAKKTLSMLK